MSSIVFPVPTLTRRPITRAITKRLLAEAAAEEAEACISLRNGGKRVRHVVAVARVVKSPPNAIKKAVKKALAPVEPDVSPASVESVPVAVPVPVFVESDAAPFFAPAESVLVLPVEPVAVPAVAYTPTPDEDLISANGRKIMDALGSMICMRIFILQWMRGDRQAAAMKHQIPQAVHDNPTHWVTYGYGCNPRLREFRDIADSPTASRCFYRIMQLLDYADLYDDVVRHVKAGNTTEPPAFNFCELLQRMIDAGMLKMPSW
jgi:hypothetical protein